MRALRHGRDLHLRERLGRGAHVLAACLLVALSSVSGRMDEARAEAPAMNLTVHLDSIEPALSGITLQVMGPLPLKSYLDGKARSPALPVLFFNPGWRMGTDANERLLERLAAKDFVVIGVDRSRKLTDGQGDLDLGSPTAFRSTLARANAAARDQAGQMVRVLDLLARTPPFDRMLDFGRVGIFGYSFGGAVAVETCLLDARFKAAINIDGWLFAEAADLPLRQPFMMLTDATPPPEAGQLESADPTTRFTAELDLRTWRWLRRQIGLPGAYWIQFQGATHEVFADPDIKDRLRALVGRTGPRRKLVGQVDTYARQFFEKTLLGRPSALLVQAAGRRITLNFEGKLIGVAEAPASPAESKAGME